MDSFKEKIMNRVQEHYNYLIAVGYDVVFTALQGSQNYGLDEYNQEYQSDVDTKSIVLPCLNDFIDARAPISAVEILDNNEHAEVKDIRVMFQMFKKANLSYIELLYSDYIIFNPKYEKLIKPIFDNRDKIIEDNYTAFVKCLAGMAYEKRKVLCHPFPAVQDKIDKYGYDGKQLSHLIRLYEFMSRFKMGEPAAACFKSNMKKALMNLKKQKDIDGNVLSKDAAVGIADFYLAAIDRLRDEMICDDNGVVGTCPHFLDEIKSRILKYKIRKEILEEEMNYFKELCNDMVYFSEEENKAASALIEALAIEEKENFYDYYEKKS